MKYLIERKIGRKIFVKISASGRKVFQEFFRSRQTHTIVSIENRSNRKWLACKVQSYLPIHIHVDGMLNRARLAFNNTFQ